MRFLRCRRRVKGFYAPKKSRVWPYGTAKKCSSQHHDTFQWIHGGFELSVSLGETMGCIVTLCKWWKYSSMLIFIETSCTSRSLEIFWISGWIFLRFSLSVGEVSLVCPLGLVRLTPLKGHDKEQNPKGPRGSRLNWKWPFMGFHIRSLVAVPDANPIDWMCLILVHVLL